MFKSIYVCKVDKGVLITKAPELFCKKRCSQKFCKISKNSFFTEHPWATASIINLKHDKMLRT